MPPTTQPLEVQLGGDAQVEVEVVGVDVGLERPGVGAAVDRLQDRGLDLGEAAGVQRVADAAHDRGPLVGRGARLGPHDQVDVPRPDARLGVGQALVLVGQRPQRLAGQQHRVGADRQLARVGGDHLAGDRRRGRRGRCRAPRRTGRPRPRCWASTITWRSPLPSRSVANPSPPMSRLSRTRPTTETVDARSRCPAAGPPDLGRDLGQRVGARRSHGVGVDALLAEPVELGAAHPHLLGQVLGGHRLGDDVARRRDQGEHGGGVLAVGPVEGLVGVARRAQHEMRRHGQEALGAAGGGTDPRQVGGVLEARGSAAASRAGTSRWSGRATRAASSGWPAAVPGARAARPARRRSRRRARTPRGTSRSSGRPARRRTSAPGRPGSRPSARRARCRRVGSRRIRSSDRPVRPHGTKLRKPRSRPSSSCAWTRTHAPSSGSPSRPSAIEKPRSSPPSPRHWPRGLVERGEVRRGSGSRGGRRGWCSRGAAAGRPTGAPPSCRGR